MPIPNVSDMGVERATLKENHDFCMKLWKRMDRDNSRKISRSELDCEEFRDVLRGVITPMNASLGTGGVTYMRAQQNIEQAVDFCLRKADFNHDSALTFEEFKSFMVALRSTQGDALTADLIFALFDLDCDGRISLPEFREIYRYYTGHNPTQDEFVEEWRRLDAGGNDEVTKAEYIKWLQTSANPIFKQHAPALRGFGGDAASTLNSLGKTGSKGTLPGLGDTNQTALRYRWNQNFNTKKNGNHEVPAQQRNMFSRPQSLPELTRYFELHRGFQKNKTRLENVPETRRHKGVLSTDSVPEMMPNRNGPGGTMRSAISGRAMPWNDHWQEPFCMKKKPPPVTLLFQCPGKPPASLYGRTEEDY